MLIPKDHYANVPDQSFITKLGKHDTKLSGSAQTQPVMGAMSGVQTQPL
jgi:hypothetical protein